MRSPWAVGVAVLAWLQVSSILARDPASIAILWGAGLLVGIGIICLARSRPRAAEFADPRSPSSPSPGVSIPLPPPPGPAPSLISPSPTPVAVTRQPPPVTNSVSPPPLAPQAAAPRIWTSDEVAALLRVDEPSVIELIQRGELPGNHVGGRWRTNDDSFRRWLDGKWSTPSQGADVQPRGTA
jgi:excisionase family DNA binding protein